MKAAVLHALGEAPSYEGFAEPTPNKDETLVSVRAASLKNSDKMMADGSRYDSLRQLPAVVGLDEWVCSKTARQCIALALGRPTGRWRRRPSCRGLSACPYRMLWTI